MPSQRLSLAQQIAELDEPTPVDLDPEDEQCGSPHPRGDTVEAREHYIEVGPSTLRLHLDSVIDSKYVGTKITRKQLEGNNSLGAISSDSPEQATTTAFEFPSSEGSSSEDDEEEALSPGEEEIVSEDEQSTRRLNEGIQENPSHEKDLSSTIRKRRGEDREKGKAVTKQLKLWDSLLDTRIRLQKSLIASNRLPSPTEMSEFTSHPRCLEARHAMLAETLGLVEDLSALREELMKGDKEVRWQPRKRRCVQDGSEQGRRCVPPEIDNVDQDWGALIREANEDAAGLEKAYHAHLTRTLEKWSAKVVAVAPSALLPTSRKRFSLVGSTKEAVKSVGTQIEDMLQGEWPALLSRTRLKRCSGPRVTREVEVEGGDNVFEEDEEIFDDTDFYQQLLRDVIDSKGRGLGQVIDWTTSQKQKKSKKDVDTRASKGRKLRYEVHEKIQNFMVPVPLGPGVWHEAQTDELFASLLGKGYKMTEDDMEESSPPSKSMLSVDTLSGFRVFG